MQAPLPSIGTFPNLFEGDYCVGRGGRTSQCSMTLPSTIRQILTEMLPPDAFPIVNTRSWSASDRKMVRRGRP
jgi:hypothetical protein